MEFFDWSKGCVYLRSYVDIVPVYTEYDVLQSHHVPIDRNAAVSPESESVEVAFSGGCISGAVAR